MSPVWWRVLGQLLGLLIFVCWPVRHFYGDFWAVASLAGGLGGFLLWHSWQLSRLLRWLNGPFGVPLPSSRGIWDHVFAGLHRRVRVRSGQQRLLSDTLERFNRAAQAMPDGIIAFNKHRQIVWLNERAEQHFQLSATADQGQALTNLVRHPDLVAYLDAARFDEALILHSDRIEGQTLLLQIIPYGDDQSLLVSRDISQIERLENMRRDFVANVSHELKTPLTVVAGFAEMLADGFTSYEEGEVRHYLHLIHEQSTRMRRLIEDLLTLSALETAGAAQVDEQVEVGALLQTVLAEAEALSGGRHVFSLSIETSAGLCGSASELRSAFANLASNAVRYTPPDGHIALTWRAVADGLEFSVKDSGIGIAPQHVPRLTERFYRVDRSRSRETGGTGLGLAIVKHVLTRHQASLAVHSEIGKGSTFTVHFPAARVLP